MLIRSFILFMLVFTSHFAFAGSCGASCTKGNCKPSCDVCCGNMGGVQYCDSSAGRLVCNNGFYSSCYCTPHAAMGLHHLQGCCLWQGGVMQTDAVTGYVICMNGSVSEVCSSQDVRQSVASW